jgi:hypothetical protein
MIRISSTLSIVFLLGCHAGHRDDAPAATASSSAPIASTSVATSVAPSASVSASISVSISASISASAPTPECAKASDCVANDPCFPSACVPPARAKKNTNCPDIVGPTISCGCFHGKCTGTITPPNL